MALVLVIACASGNPRPPVIHAHVATCELRRTIQGDARYLVTLEFELNGVHRTETVIMDFRHYGRIRDLSEVCFYPTVYGYDLRPCR